MQVVKVERPPLGQEQQRGTNKLKRRFVYQNKKNYST
jgi:hypothetical protein